MASRREHVLFHGSTRERALLDRLAPAIRSAVEDPEDASNREQPWIRLGSTAKGIQHITVLWDGWRGIPLGRRSELILGANAQLDHPLPLIWAIGRTFEEALSLGYFRFRVTRLASTNPDADDPATLAALRDHGAVEFEGRFVFPAATEQEADEILSQVSDDLPAFRWKIVQEVDRGD